jgi:hypothetical protein|nr:MAG TPA: hypothetical protein [Crassvirales sp.]
MEELSLDNILTGSEVENLFIDDDTSQEPAPDDTGKEKKDDKPDEGKEKETTEVNVDSLFTDKPESVGSGDTEEKEDTDPDKGSTSPKIYSSIAKAFAEEGIFPDLDEEAISKVETPEDLRELVEQQIKAGLDERQKRIDEALNVGVEPDTIRQYEGAINYLDSIKDDSIAAETDEGEKLRKQLIYQDFINRGYSKERASREVQKSLNGGTDVDDAREALKSNKEYFKSKYEEVIEDAKKEEEAEVAKRKEQAEKLRTSILTEKKVFGDIEVDKTTRQRIYDNIAKPIYKDPETGEMLTAIQRYEMEHRTEFLKNLGLIFTLTDGFKNLDGLVKGKVRKEVKRGFRELENTLNNTARTSDGNLNYASGVDSESFIGKGWTIDA